ncbi:hypothetical protein F5148DRAFT_984542 [Russula earlei]|uniref:Uncharacterized protein n=1 Tax=Russula earlei TaxID=71964 RepID=A0ACC0U1L8_9AGAM|nr:hypothetical protein F5148DRAFT_984542 [Russula earlei]
MPLRFDVSIAGDEQELSRIQLEKNLLTTDLSLHLSSTHDEYSVENPRHQSIVSVPFSAFDSIDRSGEALDLDDGLSQPHAWSYRTGGDDEGIHTFVGGETLSTAAHHASALTLSAGLAARGERRDVSLSGAEYDPERPLQDLIAGIGTKFNLSDAEKEPSRRVSNVAPFPMMGNTAELNHQIRSAQQGNARRVSSPYSEQSTSSMSEPDTPDPTSSKPKFSDALSHLTVSQKRPRSPALRPRSASPAVTHGPTHGKTSSNQLEPQHQPQGHRITPRPASLRVSQVDAREGEPTPRPRKVHLRTQDVNSANALHPLTPSTANSHFTRFAKGLAREIEAEQTRWHAPLEVEGTHVGTKEGMSTQRAREKRAVSGGHFFTTTMLVNTHAEPSNAKRKQVQLPDITGLTVAVESPAKGQSYQPYGDAGKEHGDEEGHVRLQLAMSHLQKKIAHLDADNHTSRRRMKELERELDVCRQDVERQRELVMRREELLVRQQVPEVAAATSKGKARVTEDTKEDQKRYQRAVAEKKALETLITTLRSHMARLTADLSSQKTLLDQLRSLREADKNTLRQKVREVDLLKREVEKIAGEVEVLKGVVEEGLRERRERGFSKRSDEPHGAGLDVSQREGNISDEVEREPGEESLDVQQDDDDYEIEDVQPALARRALLERTAHTDYATHGSSQMPGSGSNAQRYVEHSELERISAELEERRSERSRSSSRLGSSVSSNGSHRAASVVSSVGPARNRLVASPSERHDALDNVDERRRQEAGSSVPLPQEVHRPPAPTPGHARERHHSGEAPFPQIRGARLEQMFFSAPEHNTQTCTVCNRRRYRGATSRPLWYPASKGHNVTVGDANDEEDEGFEDESVKASEEAAVNLDFLNGHAGSGRLPPQTVLVRVLRELEDDFTHYKGIYTELADQYKMMDAASNVVKRNVLAQHLREVIDVLEQRGDQIASLYDLLTFEDKPVARSVVAGKDSRNRAGRSRLERTHQSRNRPTFA